MNYEQRRRSRADVSEAEGEYDDQWPARLPSTSRRYDLTEYSQGNASVTWHPDRPVSRSPIPTRRT